MSNTIKVNMKRSHNSLNKVFKNNFKKEYYELKLYTNNIEFMYTSSFNPVNIKNRIYFIGLYNGIPIGQYHKYMAEHYLNNPNMMYDDNGRNVRILLD